MKSLTIHTFAVAMAMMLWGTSSMAATGDLSPMPVSPAEQTDTHSVTAATSPAPLFALSGLDAQTLAAQEMTDQELKAVEGGARWEIDLGIFCFIIDTRPTVTLAGTPYVVYGQ